MLHFQGELITEREALEAMSPRALAAYSVRLGEMVTKIEAVMSLTSEVLEGAYGTTVEEQLDLSNRP